MKLQSSTRSSRLARIASAIVLPAMLSAAVHAEPQNPLTLAATRTNSAPADSQSPREAGARLSNDQLGDALSKYGKNTITNNDVTYYQINVKRGTWTIPITVSLSPNGNVIWLQVPLTSIDDSAKVSPTALVNLLKKNSDLGPAFFELVNTRLNLTEPVANHNMNAATLAANIENFIKIVQSTESLWSQDVLTPNN